MKKLFVICSLLFATEAFCASVVATINGMPVTDADITARTRLMALQGQTGTDNRVRALSNIIDDNIKLAYADSIKLAPTDAEVKKEIEALKQRGFDASGLNSTGLEMLNFAMRANIAWQIIVGRTIMPTISVTDEDVKAELAEIERAHGLPVEITFIRLVGIPESSAAKLTKPESCAAAEKMARDLGGAPQKITAPGYELSEDIRERVAGLALMTWSARAEGSVILVCEKNKTKEYGKLDEVVRQNAVFKRAMFVGDQQLKQLRRKAVIIINDPKYKEAI